MIPMTSQRSILPEAKPLIIPELVREKNMIDVYVEMGLSEPAPGPGSGYQAVSQEDYSGSESE